MATTKIEWTASYDKNGKLIPGKVWNPVVGCTPVSAGCAHCYAKRIFERFHPGESFSDVKCLEDRLEQPFRWKKPTRIFVNSMSDLFHPDVPDVFIHKVFRVIIENPRHTFLVLTKRPERMIDRVPVFPVSNVWLGVSVEDQKTADERIPILLQIPAAIRFVSVEPMLGAVNLKQYLVGDCRAAENVSRNDRMGLDWLICGGESGPWARPIHQDWARSLRDQCQAAGVPFFFKQWGEWTSEYPQKVSMANRKQTYVHGSVFYRIGKTSAGRLLDGLEWNEYPEEQ